MYHVPDFIAVENPDVNYPFYGHKKSNISEIAKIRYSPDPYNRFKCVKLYHANYWINGFIKA